MNFEAVAARLGLPKDASGATILETLDRRISERRDNLVAAAVADGRISSVSRSAWRDELDKSPVVAEAALHSLLPVKAAAPPPEDPPWFPQFSVRQGVAS